MNLCRSGWLESQTPQAKVQVQEGGMGNKPRRPVDAEQPRGRPAKKPPGRWPFWRVVYWLGVLLLVVGICVGMYFTLKSDFGECSSYDVRCD